MVKINSADAKLVIEALRMAADFEESRALAEDAGNRARSLRAKAARFRRVQAKIAATAPARADGQVDCQACGHHGSRCQEDLDNGTTICHTTTTSIRSRSSARSA